MDNNQLPHFGLFEGKSSFSLKITCMYLLKKLVQFGGKTHGAISSWKTGWNNQFALGYELGLYYNFTLEGNN